MNEYNLVRLTKEQEELIEDYNELEYQLGLSRMRLESFCTFDFYKNIIIEFANKHNFYKVELEHPNAIRYDLPIEHFHLELNDDRWLIRTYTHLYNGKLFEIKKFINRLEDFEDELSQLFGSKQNQRMVARYVVDNNIKVDMTPNNITDLIASPGFYPMSINERGKLINEDGEGNE